ncbi:MAG TPA: divergent polysaccharide deacetylase family protein [Candidatus Anoxymicrobiaceae bacterium]
MKDDGYPENNQKEAKRIQQRRAYRLAERRRRARRNRTITIAVAAAVIVTAILLSPVGPLKGALYSKSNSKKTTVKAADKNDSKSTKAAKVVKTTTPAVPVHVEKKSNTTPPTIGIVVDDTGNVTDKLPLWTAIDAPLCFAVMPYPPLSQQLAEQLWSAGYVVMMHVPTDNAPPNSFSGTGQLATGMDRATVFATLDTDISKVPHATGMNNHQGGRGCDQLDLMTCEVEWAKSKGLFVVDSNSSVSSKVTKACQALGLPKRLNEVFIDHQNEPDYIRGAMRELAGLARKNGTAIGICHWHRPNTATVVGEMIQTLKAEGIHFAFARDITD